MTDKSLAGRGALITGSTGGLGLAVARALAARGCRIVLHGIEPETTVSEKLRPLERESGVDVSYVQADLADADAVERLAAAARAELGSVDMLVNNAVVRHFAPIESFPLSEWERALAVNLTAAFRIAGLVLGDMRAQAYGRIINMASVYGSRGTVNRVDYVTTKHALIGLTRAIAMETVGQGITCNAICPGSVRTPAIDARVAALADSGLSAAEAESRFLAGKQPTGRFVDAGDVAELIAFLCSDAGRDITGAVLPVDGGWLAS